MKRPNASEKPRPGAEQLLSRASDSSRNGDGGTSDSAERTSASTAGPNLIRAAETPRGAASAGYESAVGSSPPSEIQIVRSSSKSWSSEAIQKIGTAFTPAADSISRASDAAVRSLYIV